MVEAHAGMNKAWPGVVEALDLIGSQQIQGRCSLAGNLCNASPAADSVPAMFAAGAIAVVVGSKGKREVPVEQIPTAPGRTSLAKDEFILEFKFPPRPANSGDAYLRFIPRTEMDIAVVGVGINLTLDAKGVCTAARVAVGAVAPTVLLVQGCGRRTDRPHARRGNAEETRCGGARGVQADQRQARNDRIPHQDCRRAGTPRGRHRVRPRHGQIARKDALI